MNILALDLGVNLGYCILREGEGLLYGKVNLRTKKKHDKYHKFSEWLKEVIEQYEIKVVFYERVDFSFHTYSAQAHGAFVGTIHNVCNYLKQVRGWNIFVDSFSVPEVKKGLTNMGNASKMGMIHYAEKYVDATIVDDNVADAIGVMKTGIKKHFRSRKNAEKSKTIDK